MEKFSIKIEDMNLSQIAESGQVFRMREENGAYRLYTGKNTASVTENDGIFTFDLEKSGMIILTLTRTIHL